MIKTAYLKIPICIEVPNEPVITPETIPFDTTDSTIVVSMTEERRNKFSNFPKFRIFHYIGNTVIESSEVLVGVLESELVPVKFELRNNSLKGFILIEK